MPAMLKDRAIEAGLLPHVAARLFDCSARAGGHVRGLQGLDADRAEAARERCGSLVVPVLAGAGRAGFVGGGTAAGLGIALRSPAAACRFPLRGPVAAVKNAKPLNRHGRKLAGRKRDGVCNTAVDTNGRAIPGYGARARFRGQTRYASRADRARR